MPAKQTQEAITVGEIKKRDDVRIVASLTRYRNELYIDLREYVESETYQGPTKKGIRFHFESWEDFKKLIEQIDLKIKEIA